MQHAARQRSGIVDLHGVAEPGQVIGGGKAARAGADDEDPLARWAAPSTAERQPCLRRQIAEEPLHRMDADTASSSWPRLHASSQGW